MSEYRKAILAAIIAGLTALLPAVQNGFDLTDLVGTALAAVIAFGGVWAIPNAPAEPPRA